jgi:hypothetical protein
LIYTEELNNLLCNKLQQAYDESLALIQAKINKAANLFEAYKIIKPLRNYRFNSLIGSGDEFKFKFRNVQMSKLALLDMEPVITDPRVIEAVSNKDTSITKPIGCYMHTKDGANDRTSVKKYLFHRGTDLSLDESTIWCINDLPDVNVERIPVRYVDHLHRYGAVASSGIKLSGTKRTIIVINNNKVVLDVMEEKFPGIKDSFMCKFSDLEKWCPKPPVVKRDPQNKIAKVKVEKTQDNGNEHIINKSHARVADFLTEEGITVGYATAQNNVVYMPISNLTDMQGRRVVRDKHQYFTSALRHILTLPVIRDVIKPYKIYGIKEANLEEILGVIKPEQKWVTIGDFLKMLPNLIKNSGNKAFNEFIEFLCTCHLLHSQLCEFPKLKGATYDQIRKDQHVYQVLDWLDIVLAESAELPKQSKLLRAISAMRELINPEYIKSFTAEHSTISRIYDVMETNAHDWLGVPKETIQHSKQTNKFMDMFSDAWLNSDAFKALCYINGDYVLTQNYSFQRGGGDHRKNLIRLLIPQL